MIEGNNPFYFSFLFLVCVLFFFDLLVADYF
ncbi:hypothetical protein MPF_2020 [Methanohalophilus portucalensis FDF-1]|uniref:Uncharacterized protein n=1 Tax=Methanohalophilus portucalensis FDF-1 TaxID=523843 RepID=A0A1L9C1P7_9EURY|nr:hypothetical protein MPF_2020 [Methanohalophilus portucalensis FDF-1]